MKPFSITCTTCQARLTVRSEAAIGNILNCPRCQSMVLVQRPGDSPDASSQAWADTAAGSLEMDAEALHTPPTASPPDELPSGSGWQETMPELPAEEMDWEDGDVEQPAKSLKSRWKEVAPEASSLDADQSPAMLPTDQWTSPKTRQLKRWLILGGAGAMGLILAAVLVGFALSGADTPAPEVAQSETGDQPGAGQDSESTSNASTTSDVQGSGTEGSGTEGSGTENRAEGAEDAPSETGDSERTTEADGGAPGVASEQNGGRQPSGLPAGENPTADGEAGAAGSNPVAGSNPSAGPAPAPGMVTPAEQPGSAAPGTGRSATSPGPEAPGATSPAGTSPGAAGPVGVAEDGPPGLKPRTDDAGPSEPDEAVADLLDRFAPLLNDAPVGADPVEAPNAAGSETAGSETAGAETAGSETAGPETAGGDALPLTVQRPERPAPRQIDVTARMAEPIVEVAFDQVPLEGLVHFAQQFSTVPITVDPQVLKRRQISWETPVSFRQKDTTLGQALTLSLEPLGLAWAIVDNGVVIGAAEARVEQATYPIDDLLGPAGDRSGSEAAEVGRLQGWIQSLVAPSSWRQAEGTATLQLQGGSLLVEAPPAERYGVLEVLERLRTARKLPLRGSYDAALFQLPTRLEQAGPKLSQRFLLNFVDATPLPEILDRMAKDGGIRIRVDWHALGQVGWTPEARLRFSMDNHRLRTGLNSLLRPMDLAFRVLDAQTLEVTTPAALERQPELELYSIPDLLADDVSAEKLISRIRDTLGAERFAPEGPGRLHFDPVSRCLLVRLPQPGHWELHELLMQLRAEG